MGNKRLGRRAQDHPTQSVGSVFVSFAFFVVNSSAAFAQTAYDHPADCWLRAQYGTNTTLTGTNPPLAEIHAAIQQLAQQYNVPVEIIGAVCANESIGVYQWGSDGFVVHNIGECRDLFNGTLTNGPPGLGLMQLTGAAAQATGDIPRLITDWRFNLEEGVKVLNAKYELAFSHDHPTLQAIEDQNRNVLENWFYALWFYNGFVVGTPNNYPYTIYDIVASPPSRLDGLFAPVSITRPETVICDWTSSFAHGFAAKPDGEWLCNHLLTFAGPVHLTGGVVPPLPPTLSWPVENPTVTQEYNSLYGVKYHAGLDLVSCRGNTVVRAAGPGIVRTVPNGTYMNSNHRMGNVVIVNHTGGYSTLYAHLASIVVTNGQTVSAGTQLGTVGDTGCSGLDPPCGVHLHFEVKYFPVLGNLHDDLGPEWGYTPGHPNLYGYMNPNAFLGLALSEIDPIVVVASSDQIVRTGPDANIYLTAVTSVHIGQEFAAFAQYGTWYHIVFPSINGPATGWIQATANGAGCLMRVIDPVDAHIGVDVVDNPSTASAVLSKVWNRQWLAKVNDNPSDGGSWYQTGLAANAGGASGWICAQHLSVPQCAQCSSNSQCNNGLFCDGLETCVGGICVGGSSPCPLGTWCHEQARQCAMLGDYDGDGDVDLQDIAGFLRCFLRPGTGGCAPGDLQGTGVVDLANFGELRLRGLESMRLRVRIEGDGEAPSFGVVGVNTTENKTCPPDCTYALDEGTPVALTASVLPARPAACDGNPYITFAGWDIGVSPTSGCDGVNPSCSLSMTQDVIVTARFKDSRVNASATFTAPSPNPIRIIAQDPGDFALSSQSNFTVSTGGADVNICVASVKPGPNTVLTDVNHVPNAGPFNFIEEIITFVRNNFEPSSQYPQCMLSTGGETVFGCGGDLSPSCILVDANTTNQDVSFRIKVFERLWELNLGSPYKVTLEARDPGTGAPVANAFLDFWYQVPDIGPR